MRRQIAGWLIVAAVGLAAVLWPAVFYPPFLPIVIPAP